MNVRNIPVDPAAFLEMMALDSKENYLFKDNKRTDIQEGFAVEVCLSGMAYEKGTLKVDKLPANLTHEALVASGPVKVKPVGVFTKKLYQNKEKEVGLSLHAESAEVVGK